MEKKEFIKTVVIPYVIIKATSFSENGLSMDISKWEELIQLIYPEYADDETIFTDGFMRYCRFSPNQLYIEPNAEGMEESKQKVIELFHSLYGAIDLPIPVIWFLNDVKVAKQQLKKTLNEIREAEATETNTVVCELRTQMLTIRQVVIAIIVRDMEEGYNNYPSIL